MQIAILGAGGVGGYFGGRLAVAGQDVIFIARGTHLQALWEHGLRVESPEGDFTVHPVRATDDPSRVGPVDAVIVAVKGWQLDAAAAAAAPLLAPDTCVVPLLNGVDAPDRLAVLLGEQHAAAGLCGIISYIVEPGRVRHAGGIPYVQFGERDNRPTHRLERLREAFVSAGVRAEIPVDIRAALWLKLLIIGPWSGTGAVTRAPVGVWWKLMETRRVVEAAIDEIIAVATARGVALPGDARERTRAWYDRLPAEGTSSLQRDVMAALPSELESQIGVVVRYGRDLAVPTPVHDCFYASLLPQEMKARGLLDGG